MPILGIAGVDIDLPRNVALVDTNVLVARFNPRDALHEEATLTLDDDDRFEWVVTAPVLVEACGLLMQRSGHSSVVEMLKWLVTPGNRVRLLACIEGPKELEQRLPEHTAFIARRKVDLVDAYLMRAASVITHVCGLVPNTPIVTSDSKDFHNGRGAGYRYSLLDLREPGGEVIPM